MPLAVSGPRRVPRRPRLGGNVSRGERIVSLVGGGALAAYALRRRDRKGLALAGVGGLLLQRGATGRCPIYQALGVSSADGWHLRPAGSPVASLHARRAVKVERSATVLRPAAELYACWRDFANVPRFMELVASVTVLGPTRSHWVAMGPAGTRIQWDVEIHNERPGELIAWRSVGRAPVPNAGSVRFRPAPGGRGTEVRLVLDFEPPAGRLGYLAIQLFGEDPGRRIEMDLRRFKQLVETGDVVRAR